MRLSQDWKTAIAISDRPDQIFRFPTLMKFSISVAAVEASVAAIGCNTVSLSGGSLNLYIGKTLRCSLS